MYILLVFLTYLYNITKYHIDDCRINMLNYTETIQKN